ncbi:hypothetical protein F2Q70_00024756 [Brassica cretica]|uniref:Uncharacterized protein n=1 Tax=Brassica cretica TaxID=69181 RepID=A0A8S9L6Q0_BRACR|nr:hypothetical protein F2Q70_00024756 [Brassica cretica]
MSETFIDGSLAKKRESIYKGECLACQSQLFLQQSRMARTNLGSLPYPSSLLWKARAKESNRLTQTVREERGELSGGEVCARIEGSVGCNERLGGGGGGDELRGGVQRQVSETWSSSP